MLTTATSALTPPIWTSPERCDRSKALYQRYTHTNGCTETPCSAALPLGASGGMALSVQIVELPHPGHQASRLRADPHGTVVPDRRRQWMGVRMFRAFGPGRRAASPPQCLDSPFLHLVSDGCDALRQRLIRHRRHALGRTIHGMQDRRHLTRKACPRLIAYLRNRRT